MIGLRWPLGPSKVTGDSAAARPRPPRNSWRPQEGRFLLGPARFRATLHFRRERPAKRLQKGAA